MIIMLFELTPKHSVSWHVLKWDYTTNRWLASDGETSGPDSHPVPLPYGGRLLAGGANWPTSPGFEGQMIADIWKPPRARRKQSGRKDRRGCGRSRAVLPGRWKSYMMSAWLSVHIHSLTVALREGDVMPPTPYVGHSYSSPWGAEGSKRATELDNWHHHQLGFLHFSLVTYQ